MLFNQFVTGHDTVGTSSQPLSDVAYEAHQIVRVKADADNSDNVYVGSNPGVSSGTGYRLDAGESVDLPVTDTDKIYVVGGDAGQGYSFLVI